MEHYHARNCPWLRSQSFCINNGSCDYLYVKGKGVTRIHRKLSANFTFHLSSEEYVLAIFAIPLSRYCHILLMLSMAHNTKVQFVVCTDEKLFTLFIPGNSSLLIRAASSSERPYLGLLPSKVLWRSCYPLQPWPLSSQILCSRSPRDPDISWLSP